MKSAYDTSRFVALLGSPALWQLTSPDRFDTYSVGVLLLQVRGCVCVIGVCLSLSLSLCLSLYMCVWLCVC